VCSFECVRARVPVRVCMCACVHVDVVPEQDTAFCNLLCMELWVQYALEGLEWQPVYKFADMYCVNLALVDKLLLPMRTLVLWQTYCLPHSVVNLNYRIALDTNLNFELQKLRQTCCTSTYYAHDLTSVPRSRLEVPVMKQHDTLLWAKHALCLCVVFVHRV